MTTRKPLFNNAGTMTEIASPDTIDPALLPASSAASPLVVADGATRTIAADTQETWDLAVNVIGIIVIDGALVVGN